MIANRNGQKLAGHLKLVGAVAREMARHAGMDDYLQNMCECAGYAHDLGKAVTWFQKYIKKTNDNDDESSEKPLHHEISWAYLAEKYDRDRRHKLIMNAVYWHHSRPVREKGDFYKDSISIMEKLNEKDRKAIDNVANRFDWSKGFNFRANFEAATEDVPYLFERESDTTRKVNAELLAVRTCLIAADRCVSALNADDFQKAVTGELSSEEIVKPLMLKRLPSSPLFPQEYDRKRFDIQAECSMAAYNEKTAIVRAPAGFGKTMIGLLWGLKSNERFLWVCPRNVVAEAVYKNIVRELQALKLYDVSAELHLTGERQDATHAEVKEFCSDIIVTNIDTILRPMIDNRIADRLFGILASSVILDEFHEFASDQPLFAAFITLMRARHMLCNGVKTLLLSATPMAIHQLWDTDGNETVQLPSSGSHYRAAHQGIYAIRIVNKIPENPRPGSLAIFNSVARAQDIYKTRTMNYVLHSRFTDSDRKKIIDAVFKGFGKAGNGVASGEKVVSALVIQAAMDVSFACLYESLCSPEFTLQRIGRCDRWGNYQHMAPEIVVMLIEDDNERGAIRTVYDVKLRTLWLEHLKLAIDGKETIRLDDLYDIYNIFYENYNDEVKAFLKEKYKKGLDYLREYYPIKLIMKSDKDEQLRGGRNLRNPFGSYFFSVQKDTGQWLGPDEVMDDVDLRQRYEKKSQLGSELYESGKMLYRIKGLYEAGFERYRRYIKRERPPNNPNGWFKLARSAETPLPDFSRKYSPEIGLYEERRS